MTKKKVTIYSTPVCHYCKLAKDYFATNKVAYTEYDVAGDIDRRNEMIERSGQMGVPVIVVGDELVVGFDRPAIAELLGLKT